MNATLVRFHEDCRVYYAVPRHRHNTAARVRAYKSLLRRHSAATLNRHVRAIGSVLTRVELQYATGQVATMLAVHLREAA